MIVAMLALVALISLGTLTALAVQSTSATSGHDRFKAISLYAAESGAAAGMDFLRRNIDAAQFWSVYVTPNNDTPVSPGGIPGNGIEPGDAGNLFSPEMLAWYEVTILNNIGDAEFTAGTDSDARVVLQVIGHGPNGATTQIELDVGASGITGLGRPCPVYGQKGMAEDGAGRNDCLSVIESTDVTTFRPGG
jgi:hypothetical protein